MNSNETTAPAYLAKSTRTGKWSIALGPNRRASGYFATSITAADLAAESTEGTVYESFGTPSGRRFEHFGPSRYVADAEGNLHMYNDEGRKVLVHPANRELRVLRKRA